METADDKRKSKRRRGWLIALLLILLLGGGAFAGWWFWNEAEQQRIEENQVDIPDVSGMPETDAQNALTTAGLRPILEYEHSDDVERDRAIGTEPAGGVTMQRYDAKSRSTSFAGTRRSTDPRLAAAGRFGSDRARYARGTRLTRRRRLVRQLGNDSARDRLVDTNPSSAQPCPTVPPWR